ncbi:MFS transporter [Nocardia sp. NPDC059228]|uniref:MFS transporter n=1 Tax=Nocardia sp. NPDC059228 TaxID=3346777 RepID=UPI0036B5F895
MPRFPWPGLAALGTAGFVTIMTEAMPAGILPAMSSDLGVSQSTAGQTVTAYAIGSMLAAVPLTAATARWPRKRLLLTAIAGFAGTNLVTAATNSYVVMMVSRFVAGVVAGLLWALLAGHARRMVVPAQQGRALAVAMAGTPIALSLGLPIGTVLATTIGWRWTFAAMSGLALALMVWTVVTVPDVPTQPTGLASSIPRTARIPGVLPVLVVTGAFVLAHNILYTYIAAYLTPVDLAPQVDLVLLVFGIFSLPSIWLTGLWIDRHLRATTITACALFSVAVAILAVYRTVPMLVFTGVALWGLAFGGAATLLQTALARAAGPHADTAQSLLVTGWNAGIAGGGSIGGLVLAWLGSESLSWIVLALTIISLAVTVSARRHGFPKHWTTAAAAARRAGPSPSRKSWTR